MTPAPRTDAHPLRRLLAGLVVLVLAGLAGLLPLSPASADETTEPVTISITSITPTSSEGTGSVTIRGTARNTGTEAFQGAQVYLWRSTDPIRDGATLSEVLASDPSNPTGARLYEDRKNYFNLTTTSAEDSQGGSGRTTLAPGQSVDFTVTGDLGGPKGFGFVSTPAAYLVGLQVKVAGRPGVFGRARALLPVAKPHAAATTVVVQLESRPALLSGDTFVDNHLAGELTGRLRTLMDLALTPGVTALVDPALYDEVQAMANGYRVQGSTESTAAGQSAAKSFLADLNTLASRGHAYRTLYGDPDIALAEGGNRHDVLERAAKALPRSHPMAGLPLAILPRNGAADAGLVDFVSDLHPSVVLVAGSITDQPVANLAGTTLVRYAADVDDGGPGPDPSTNPAQRIGRLQAQQLLCPTVTLVGTTGGAKLVGASASWRRLVPLDSLVATSTNRPSAQLPDLAPLAPGIWLEQVDRAGQDVTAWGELTNQEQLAQTALNQLVPRATSSSWNGTRRPAVAWARAVATGYGNVLSGEGVSLSVTPTIVTSAPEQEVPVTITNHLDQTVRVKVHFTSENPQRLWVNDSEVQSIPAGGTSTVRVAISARANGKVGVTSQLVTPSGRPIGPTRAMTITATQMGRVGWIIIVGSGIVLLGATAMRIRQVQREKRTSPPVADLGTSRG